ncbi:GxxExxY protein (plasmid) [Fusobacteria bacterium ZRK30]|nr:GxxExxY protein [Fusobacteria bacterium ZRK30]
MKYEELTSDIIKCFYKVYNTLGYGFLEKVYENSLLIELKKLGYKVESQKSLDVYYDNQVVGNYYADIVVENKIILELKSAETLRREHKNQLINYLKTTDIEVGLLLNFGEKAQLKRVMFSNYKN